MIIKSLALKTRLILDKYFASVEFKDDYIVIKTNDRPKYFWGNYIIMKFSPKAGDYDNWISIFENEIGNKEYRGFIAITFDTDNGDNADTKEFVMNGFKVITTKVLLAKSIFKPRKYNHEIEIRPFQSNEDWEKYVDIHFTPNWGYGPDEGQTSFLREEIESFKRLTDAGMGQRYGAFLDGEMVAELGVFWEDNVVRFNNVATHPSKRRIGACSTLVYEVSKLMLQREEIDVLVMEADEDYHAAKIYEEVGFKATQKLISLEWKDDSKFS